MGEEILTNESPKTPSNDPDLAQFLAFARTFLLPMIVLKVFLLYFGLNYSRYPGEGYGYGLAATLCFCLAAFAYFLWSNREAQ